MKRYPVVVSAEAERDLDDIASYIAEHDSVDRALFVVTRIERTFTDLAAFPNRGPHPKELLEYGNRDFREIYFKPYRIIYRVLADKVVVVLIADGRRDMRTLMSRRLLEA
ncbi:type II toxin-antitoxin system RelE/ParE family toxin [Reyranella sp.]|uniref:type II toxin-antitoxin system RelE/ParE family toxin n=1 Tax=Reyranella sp. TaxID=1929291 RepID=UPI003BAA3463